MAETGLDWAGLMRVGLSDLRMQPRDFWALTPAELGLLSGRMLPAGNGPMTRHGLDALSRLYPDKEKHHDGG